MRGVSKAETIRNHKTTRASLAKGTSLNFFRQSPKAIDGSRRLTEESLVDKV
jgi:hypothetical protein